MRTILAILIGKLIAQVSRFLKIGGGTAAPGLYALKIDPDLVQKLIHHIPKNVVITGTNGKTTTARMLAHFAKMNGLKVIRNYTGSNLERGITSALLEGVKLSHLEGGLRWHLSFDLGIWELDEAAFNTVASKIKPDVVVFLNVFRDQLDRYGEVDTVVKNWGKTLTALTPQTVVLVNGDDANTSKLASYFKGRVEKFGVKDYKIIGESLEHKVHPHNLDFEAKNVKTKGLSGSSFSLFINHKSYIINLPLPGIYHIYDALAAIAVASHLFTDIPIHRYTDTLKTFSPAFGRMEKFSFPHVKWERKHSGMIFLIKNPAGATQVFETIVPYVKPNDRLLLALNDNLADGTDVSWIWDANFEKLLIPSLRAPKGRGNLLNGIASSKTPRNDVIVSGTRAADLAVRLKYAGFDPDLIGVEPSLKNALKQAINGLKGLTAHSSLSDEAQTSESKTGRQGRLFILPTYTAMLQLQRILVKMGVKGHYWNE